MTPAIIRRATTYAGTNDDYATAALDELGDATAHAVLQFAMTTSAVKGTSRANDRAVKTVPLASLAYRGGRLQK